MPQTIKPKTGSGVPTTEDLADKEMAVDLTGQKLYVRDGGAVKEVGGGSLPAGTVNYTFRYDGANWVATDFLLIDDEGDVSIGGTPIEDANYLSLSMDDPTKDIQINLKKNGTNIGAMYTDGSDLWIGTNTGGDVVLAPDNYSGVSATYFNTNGDVGFGQASPDIGGVGFKDVVINGVNNTELVLQRNSGSDVGYLWTGSDRMTLGTATGYDLYLQGPGSGAEGIRISTAGATRVIPLAGVGTRMVVADEDGDLSTQTIPSAGVPNGGTQGQVIEKIDATDGNVQWVDPDDLFEVPVATRDWTPDDYTATLKTVWLDASDGVNASGSDFVSWTNKADNSNNFTVLSGLDPTVITSPDGVEFQEDGYIGPASGITLATASTIFMVLRIDGSGGDISHIVGSLGGIGSVSGANWGIFTEGAGIYIRAGLSGSFLAGKVFVFGNYFLTTFTVEAQVDATQYLNGDVANAFTSPIHSSGTFTATAFQIGYDSVTGRRMDGVLQEMIIVQGKLGLADRQLFEGYLGNKWNTVSLVAGHPYENGAPQVVVANNISKLLPTGGTAKQIIEKIDGADYNVQWVDGLYAPDYIASSVPWAPTDLAAEPDAWIDFSSSDYYTTAGSNVTAATDRSSNGNDFDSIFTGSNPVESVAWQNGLNGLDTSVAGSGLGPVSTATLDGLEFILWVYKWKDNGDQYDHLFSSSGDFHGDAATGPTSKVFSSSLGGRVGYNAAARIDGTDSLTGANVLKSQTAQIVALDFGAGKTNSFDALGYPSSSLTTRAPNVIFGEFFAFKTKPSVADIERLEGYLAWKWDTVAYLDSGHPYKSAAPTLTNVMMNGNSRLLPLGGTTGQVLSKTDDIDANVQWVPGLTGADLNMEGGDLSYKNQILAQSPTVFLPLREQAGATTLDDISTNDNDPTFVGGLVVDTTNVGPFDSMVDFDGTADYAILTNDFDYIHQTLVFTICAWIKVPLDYGAGIGIAGNTYGSGSSGGRRGFWFGFDDNTYQNAIRFGINHDHVSIEHDHIDNVITDSDPHFWVLVGRGTTIDVYKDGVSVGTLTGISPGGTDAASRAPMIGGVNWTSGPDPYGTKQIANFSIAPVQITAGQVADLYAASLSDFPKILPSGGTTNQVLIKLSDHDYDVGWGDSVGGGLAVTTISVNTTAEKDKHYHIDTAAVTVTLPASPAINDQVGVSVEDFTNCSVARNGENINGAAFDFNLNVEQSYVQFRYVNATEGWRVVAFSAPNAKEPSPVFTGTLTTAATTAVSGLLYACDTSTVGAFTLTLPASPVIGDKIGIADSHSNFATANLTVGRNGNNILGAASDLVLSTDDQAITLMWSGVSRGWIYV